MSDQNSLQPITVILTAINVGAVIAIGYFQYQLARRVHAINEHRLKMDLFDRRFAVYTAVKDFFGHIVAVGQVDDEKMHTYLIATSHAVFLFDVYIAQYIRRMYLEAVNFHYANTVMKEPTNEEQRLKAVDQRTKLMRLFSDELMEIDQRFKKFLQIYYE